MFYKVNKFYIGQTKNLVARLERHNAGKVLSTKGRTPLSLVYSEQFSTRSEAVKRESFLKSLKGNNIFKQIIGV